MAEMDQPQRLPKVCLVLVRLLLAYLRQEVAEEGVHYLHKDLMVEAAAVLQVMMEQGKHEPAALEILLQQVQAKETTAATVLRLVAHLAQVVEAGLRQREVAPAINQRVHGMQAQAVFLG